jgi:hypothetical protein
MFTTERLRRIREALLAPAPGMGGPADRPTLEIRAENSSVLHFYWQPGDMTKYDVYAAWIPGSGTGVRSSSPDQVIVGFRVGLTVFFMAVVAEDGYLASTYVAEKGFDHRNNPGEHTLLIATYLSGILSGRQTNVNFGRE